MFELAVNTGTDGLWNTIFKSNTYRWVVIPLAVILSVLLTLLLRQLKQKRYVSPDANLMDELDTGPVSLSSIGIILLVGLASLLAGASLGPEAALMASSAAIGTWLATKAKLGKATRLLTLASVGALLVAFFGSLLPIFIPLLLLYKQKRLNIIALGIVLLSGISSFVAVHIIDHQSPGYASLPPLPGISWRDFVTAFFIGMVMTIVALGLRLGIKYIALFAKKTDRRLPWPATATAFGLGIGLAYYFGGQSIQFSGSAGSKLLLETSAHYTTIGLFGLLVAKLLATAWSKATGYRGGLVFPSIYMAIALSLAAERLVGNWAGPGVMIGGLAGMFSASAGSPIIAVIVVAALLPLKFLPLALIAIIGTVIGIKALKRFEPSPVSKRN